MDSRRHYPRIRSGAVREPAEATPAGGALTAAPRHRLRHTPLTRRGAHNARARSTHSDGN
ncbi:MAG: hypothetical protein ACRDRS_20760 [Pseudonocardiaceae bacterium]